MATRTSMEHCLKTIVSIASGYEVNVYAYAAPQGTQYPYLVVTPISAGQSDYTLGPTKTGGNAGTQIDWPLLQVAGYAASQPACWDLQLKIQQTMENISEYDTATDGFLITGEWKASERGPTPFNMGGETYMADWAVSSDYRLSVVHSKVPPGQGSDMSSSSSESHSSVSSASSVSSGSSISTASSRST